MATSNNSDRRDSVIPAGWPRQQQSPPADSTSPGPYSDLPDPHGYDTLKDPSRQIRLCRILPDTGSRALALERKTHCLEDVCHQFIALSYAWADGKLEEDIEVNGIPSKVTRNLHMQLCRLRALGCDDMLWIDLPSIHQSDEMEKSAQVALMSEIFRGTNAVYVALDDRTVSIPQDEADHAQIAGAIEELANGAHFLDLSVHAAGAETVERLLYRLLDARWWERVWVVQEVVLAPACKILLASGLVPWSSLADAIKRLNLCRKDGYCSASFGGRESRLSKAIHKIYVHVTLLRHLQEGLARGQHIIEVIQCFQHLDASDPRDKINGFRGLHTGSTELPPPTYAVSSEGPFFEAMAVWLLVDIERLMTLALELNDSSMKLPSWIPGFSSKNYPFEPNYWRSRLELYKAYGCHPSLQQKLSPGMGFSYKGPGQLSVEGVQVDEIEFVASDKLTFMDPVNHVRLMKDWFVFATGREPSVNGDAPFNDFAFCDTVLGGRVQDPTQDSGWRKATAADHHQWQRAVLESEKGPLRDCVQQSVMKSHVVAAMERRMFKTKKGSLGVGPATVRPGDLIWVFTSGNAAFVTRKVDSEGPTQHSTLSERRYALQGPCYHHELMQDGFDITAAAMDEQCECLLV